MHLQQARNDARRMVKNNNHLTNPRITFEISDQQGRTQKCRWIDPAAGTFQIEGQSGFSNVDDYQVNNPQVLNMEMEEV